VPRLAPDEVGGVNVAAFMDMLAVSEGTDDGRQKTHDDGYDVIVGGGLLDSYADHPRKLVNLPHYGIRSSAAGRYQFLRATWDDLDARLGLPDFSPASQDRACVELLKQCGALALLQAGKFEEAMQAARKIWASLPGAGYGQHEQEFSDLRAAYVRFGGAA
jgi:muramidase (phage lysozyme)